MRALVKSKPSPGLELQNVPVPQAGPGEVIVRIAATSLCGTDNHIYRWDEWRKDESTRVGVDAAVKAGAGEADMIERMTDGKGRPRAGDYFLEGKVLSFGTRAKEAL